MTAKGKYDDIIDMDRPRNGRHEQMPMLERAKIFSPFAALKGFEDEIEKTRLLVDDPETEDTSAEEFP